MTSHEDDATSTRSASFGGEDDLDRVTDAAPRGDPVRRRQPVRSPSPHRLGRYELLFELARGGMGTVHVARLVGAHGFDRLVAIKQISDNQRGDAELQSFLSEARVTARISHPNVVQSLELGEEEGMPFIVMELIRGISMSQLSRELTAREELMAPEIAAWVIAKAAAGLHAAHLLTDDDGRDLGLVHRDVSPQNILLSYDGRVAVADFGIAKLVDNDPTRSGVVKGKFAYMSPEQAMSSAVDARSDVFALGVVLHEALTGERLFATRSPLETVKAILERAPIDPHDVRRDVPKAISAATMKALAKKPEDRFATAKELQDALLSALASAHLHTDEGDLATVIEQLFSTQRKRFEARLKRSLKRAATGEAPLDEAPAVHGYARSDDHTVAPTVGEMQTPATSRKWAPAAVVALAAASGMALWAANDEPPQPPTSAAATPTQAAVPSVSAALPAASFVAPGPSPPSASAAPAPSSETARSPSARRVAPAPLTRRPPQPRSPVAPKPSGMLFESIPVPK